LNPHILSGGSLTRRQARSERRRTLTLERLEERCLLSGDAVFFWNTVAINATVVDHSLTSPRLQIGPTRTSRVLAMESLAVFDAVNSITHTYTPYMTSVPALPGASIDAAASVAAHDVLVALYPYQRQTFDRDLVHSLEGIPLIPALEGAAVGYIVGQRMLAARADDGSQIDAAGQPVNYTYGRLPGQWRPDPLRNPPLDPLTPDWGGVQPFALQSAEQFGAPPPPAITSLEYAQAYEVTKAYGALFSTYRTYDQMKTGIFWGYDAQPDVCAPVRFYDQITQVMCVQQGLTEVQNARLFALVNMALADAAITSWNDKYSYDLWRPVTAIRENDPGTGPTGLGSGNPYLYDQGQGIDEGDPNWGPFGAPANDGMNNFTPPFPAYTSGHATIGGAMFGILTDYFQSNDIPFTCATDEANTQPVDQYGNPVELDPRTFNHFSDAADENAQSRIYLGIHYDFDKQQGVDSGYRIADYVFNNELQPLSGHQTGIAGDVLSNVLMPQMANDFADELTTIGLGGGGGYAPGAPGGAGKSGGRGADLAIALGNITVSGTSVTPGLADQLRVESGGSFVASRTAATMTTQTTGVGDSGLSGHGQAQQDAPAQDAGAVASEADPFQVI
jgi:hypothetical protein